MSERNHSQTPAANVSRSGNRKLIQMIGGTACLLLVAAVVAQVMRANPAVSQTEPEPAAANAAATPSRLMGRVNNQPISYEQLAQECVARHGAEVLDSIINRMIIQQECEKRGIVVKESEIRKEVEEIAGKFNLPLDAWYQMLLAERKITPDQYHRDIIWPMLALKKMAGQDTVVTEDDMRQAFVRDYGPRVEVRAIFIDGNIRRATDIADKCVASPDEFGTLAREHSSDSNSRALGGVVDPIRRTGRKSAVEEAAFKLQKGEISPVIEVGENRYVILKCEGHTEPIVTDIKDVWTELHSTLIEEKTQMAVAAIFKELEDQAQVINYLTQKSTAGPRPGQTGIRQTSGQQPRTTTR